MDKQKQVSDKISLAGLIGMLGLPTLPELRRDEGLNPSPELYTKLVIKIARNFLANVGMILRPLAEDRFQIAPGEGMNWVEVGHYLGHALNMQQGRVLINTPDDLVKNRWHGGMTQPYTDIREAVLSNLDLIQAAPGVYSMTGPAEALKRAVENLTEVDAYRTSVLGAA